MFRSLDENMLVSPQIRPEDVAEAARQGVTAIVNNRPDGEEDGQPASAEIEAAARAAGIAYHHLPVAKLPGVERTDEMAAALESAEGRVLAFCKSGTRSTWLWALAQAKSGADPDRLVGQAAAAGYDLTPLRPYLG